MSENVTLVTGGAGFIGSNFIPLYLKKNKNTKLINLDKLTYAGNLENLNEISDLSNYHFIKGDICDSDLVNKIFYEHNINNIVHFAAESHVDNSIKNPDSFIKTNINGTFNLVNSAYSKWMIKPNNHKKEYENSRFLHVSTDEVFGSLGSTGKFTESTAYSPNSPYSASKAASDHIVRSYYHTFGLNILITNCSNNYGPKQHLEKLIPTIISNAISNKTIPIYGDGKNIRDWLFVKDHCSALINVLEKGTPGETYNIGGENEIKNIDICNIICEILDSKRPSKSGKSYKEQIEFVTDRPGHDFRYAIDSSKISKELSWVPNETFETGIIKTVDWYLEKLNL